MLIYLIAPIIFAGICNMIWMKLPVGNSLKVPMDRGLLLPDGKRLFGDNKTWKGFLGMIGLTSLWMGIFSLLAQYWATARELSLIPFGQFRFPFNAWFYGAIWGLAYVLAELPNSFVKRRINIAPGQQGRGIRGFAFALLDQADSVIGCLLVIPLFYRISLIDALMILFMATAFHYLINILLFYAGLKRNRG